MSARPIGVAVIGGGMAGRAHCHGYRTAPTLFDPPLPPIKYSAVVDVDEATASDAARRYGFERVHTDWRDLLDADDVDVVSVVVANHLHAEIVVALLDAGKHVMCEKPLAAGLADATAMVAAAAAHPQLVTATGFVYRRQPAVAAIKELLAEQLGELSHFNGRYWCDYASDPQAPMTWRYRGGPGTGALADIGSHLIDLAEFVCGPLQSVRGGTFTTRITQRPVPVGVTYGHARAELSGEMEAVDNDDVATFTGTFAGGAIGTFSTSRVAPGHANSMAFEVLGSAGGATWDMDRPAQFGLLDSLQRAGTDGYRTVVIGPAQPYIRNGLPMDFVGSSFGVGDLFGFQTRALLEQVAGIDGLPPCATFADGLRDLQIADAVTRSAAAGGSQIELPG